MIEEIRGIFVVVSCTLALLAFLGEEKGSDDERSAMLLAIWFAVMAIAI
jgi:hypothetical protein